MKLKSVFLFVFLFFLDSCENILDQQREENAQENYASPYRGIWYGNYSGDESGTLTLTVSKNGYVSGTRKSSFGNETLFSGSIMDNGTLLSVYSTADGFTFYGDLKNGSGTWKKGAWSGSWNVSKQ